MTTNLSGLLEVTSKTLPKQLIAMGVVENGKIANQILMLKLGLPIPKGIILSSQAFDKHGLKTSHKLKLLDWINSSPSAEFQIRCDARSMPNNSTSTRNQPTEQGLKKEEVAPKLAALFFGLPQDRLAIIQALPEKGLERDTHSAQVIYNPHTKNVTFEIRHDIATILAREGGMPDETWTISLDELLRHHPKYLVTRVLKHREVLLPKKLLENFHHTLMRFGRIEIERETKIKIPKIEALITSLNNQADFLIESKNISQMEFEKIINLITYETTAFLLSGYKFEDFGLPNKQVKQLRVGELLSLLGFFHLGNFSKVRKEYDEFHTMKMRLNNLLTDSMYFGYLHPTKEDYLELITDAQYLAKAGILQKNRMPKLSIINTPIGHKFIYWDLIPSGY